MPARNIAMISRTGGIDAGADAPKRFGHMLAGTVTIEGAPARRTVYVYANSGVLIRRAFSAGDGSWKVTALPSRRYFVVARDIPHGEAFNAVIADYVASVPTE